MQDIAAELLMFRTAPLHETYVIALWQRTKRLIKDFPMEWFPWDTVPSGSHVIRACHVSGLVAAGWICICTRMIFSGSRTGLQSVQMNFYGSIPDLVGLEIPIFLPS
jgi:hypothetical protein